MRFGMYHKTELNMFVIENNNYEDRLKEYLDRIEECEHKELLKWTQWINKPKKIDNPQKPAWVKKSNLKPSKFKNTRR